MSKKNREALLKLQVRRLKQERDELLEALAMYVQDVHRGRSTDTGVWVRAHALLQKHGRTVIEPHPWR